MQVLVLLGMGFTSLLVQIAVLRQLLTVFSGNELDIGITLAVWLFFVGIGSAVGHRFRSRRAFGLSFLAIALLVQSTILFIGFIRPVFGLVAGETVPLATTLFSTILSLLPVCVVIGAQFPLAVAWLKGDASRAYGWEAAGAFLGGVLFTFGLSGHVDVFLIAAGISAVNILIALALFKRTRLLALLIIPVALHAGSDIIRNRFSEQDLQLVERVESRYGEITVFETRDQLNIFSSGTFDFSYPNTQADELKAHVPMALRPALHRVLLISGSPAVALEFLKYPGAFVDFVEIDPAMIDVSISLLSTEDRERLNNRRLKVIAADARNYIRTTSAQYDLVVVNLPEPSTANLNRFYTMEFFQEVKTAMNKDGVLAFDLPASHGYIGRRMQAANGSVYRALRTVFANIALASEEYGGMYSSHGPLDIDADTFIRRFEDQHIPVQYFHPSLFKDIFDPLKRNMVQARLEKIDTINRDRRPVAYLYTMMLWAEMSGGKGLNWIFDLKDREVLVFLIAVLAIAVASFWRREQAVYYSLFSTGFAVMGFSMTILLAYQASYGYVYEIVGLLTALFMAGSAIGAYAARKLEASLTWLQLAEMSFLLLFLASPLCFRLEALYYVLALACGTIGGAQFVLTNRYVEGKTPGALAGRLYALDLGGSVLGAVLISLFFVPLLGIGNTILFLFALKGSSLALLFSLQESKGHAG